MRFLLITQYFDPEIGAPQVRLAAVTRALVAKGHEVEIVTGMPNHPTGAIFPGYRNRFYLKEDWRGCKVHRVWLYPALGAGFKRIVNYLSFAVLVLFPLSRVRKPDVILVESPPPFVMAPVVFFNLFWRAKLVLNVADLWPDSITEMGLMREGMLTSILRAFEAWCYRRTHYINAVTEGIKDSLVNKKNVPINKVLFFPNGADTEMFRPQEPDSVLAEQLGLKEKDAILYAGTLGYAQGLDVALQAMAIMEARYPSAHLVFIGDGSDRERLNKLAKTLALNNVSFLSPHPPEYVANLFSICIAGFACLKSLPLFEGARPSKIFPIMASGKPVIYSGAGEGARLVLEAQAGIVSPPGDPEALSEAFAALINDREKADKYGRNGRDYVVKNLGWEMIVDKWLSQLFSVPISTGA